MRQDPGMNSRVHPNYKTKYSVKNWSTYAQALRDLCVREWLPTSGETAATKDEASAFRSLN